MKRLIFFIPFFLYAFDIQVVDGTHTNNSNDGYERASDGKIIYQPMKEKIVEATDVKIINVMNFKIVTPIKIKIIYPMKNH